MYNFDSYNVLLSIATNIAVLLMTAFVLQGHIYAINVQMIHCLIKYALTIINFRNSMQS